MTTDNREQAQVDHAPESLVAYYACTILSMLFWGANACYIAATPHPSKLLQLIAITAGMLAHQYRNIYTIKTEGISIKILKVIHILFLIQNLALMIYLIWQVAYDRWQSIF